MAFSSNYWGVNPTTRCINVISDEDTLQNILKLHFHFGSKLLRRQNPQQAEVLYDVPSLGENEIFTALKLEHELDHLQRHLSTSYGFLNHIIQSKAVGLFFDNAISGEEENTRIPFYPKDLSIKKKAVAQDSNLVSNKVQFYGAQFLREIIDCDSPSVHHPLAEFRCLAIDFFLSKLWKNNATQDLSALRQKFLTLPENENLGEILATDELAFPVVELLENKGIRKVKLGASALLECLAISRERTWRHYIYGRQSINDPYSGLTSYETAHQCWKLIMTSPFISECVNSVSWHEVGIKLFKGFPTEFYIAVDLALWPPVSPNYFQDSKDSLLEMRWADFHPGWRFLRILLWMKRNNISFTGVGPMDENQSEQMIYLQAQICADLKWRNPQDLASEWMGYFNECLSNKRYKNQMIEDDWERAMASIELLDSRLEFGARAIIQYPAIARRKSHYFQAIALGDSIYCNENTTILLDEMGYKLPVPFGVISGVELFGELIGRGYSAGYGRSIKNMIRTYAKRNFDVSIEFTS